MKIKELYSDESKWVSGCAAKDATGKLVKPLDESAVAWCLLGAVIKCYSKEDYATDQEIMNKIKTEIDTWPITVFNDTLGFAKVKALVEKLDI